MATQNIVEIPTGYYGQFNQGRPLFNAKIFVGEPDLDPEIPINQKQITLVLEDGTEVSVSQPVNTGPGGYITHNGSAATMFVQGNYSIKCLNSLDAQEYFFENVFGVPSPSGDDASFVGSVAEMDALNPGVGEIIVTTSYLSPGEDGDNTYEIEANTGQTIDEGKYILLSNGNVARGIFPSAKFGVKQFASVGDGVADDSATYLKASTFSSSLFVAPGTYDVPTGDFSATYFYSFGGVTITNNLTVRVIDVSTGNNRSLSTGDDLDTVGKAGFTVYPWSSNASNTPPFPNAGDGSLLHMESGAQAAQVAFASNSGVYIRVDDTAPFDFASAEWRAFVIQDGEVSAFSITDILHFQGARGTDGEIEKNEATDRDELQVYSSPAAFSTGSRGSGIHLYGNRDKEHAGNFAVLTGQDDVGTARMIISGGSESIPVLSLTRSGSTATMTFSSPHGITDNTWELTVRGAIEIEYNVTLAAILTVPDTTSLTYTVSGTPGTPATGAITAHPGEGARTNTDTRVTIGNGIFDFVDDGFDAALLNLKNPQGRPAINFTETNSTTEGELSVPTGEEFSIGHYEILTGTFTPQVGMNPSGDWVSFIDNTVGLGNASKAWVDVWAVDTTINVSDENYKQQIGPLPDALLDAWATVDYCQYKWNASVDKKGDGARFHVGVIAQRIKEAFEDAGLDPFAYGLLGYDDLEGGGGRYSIRSTECLMLEAALMRRTTALLIEELNALKV